MSFYERLKLWMFEILIYPLLLENILLQDTFKFKFLVAMVRFEFRQAD